MKTGWLEDLIALLDNGSVVGAAEARNISQSAFSRRVQALENTLGVELIDRTSKPNLPTNTLRVHGEQIRQLAYQQRHLLRQIQKEGQSGTKLLMIASQHAITTSFGHQIVKVVQQQGGIHVRLRSANQDECEVLLLTGQVDFAITYRVPSSTLTTKDKLIEDVMIAEDRLVPVFATEGVNELLWNFHNGELNIVGYPSDVFLGIELNRYVLPNLEKKCRVNVLAETALTPAALQFAAASLGVAWVPRALAQYRLSDGSLTELGAHLGEMPMTVMAQRLKGRVQPDVFSVWQRLSEI